LTGVKALAKLTAINADFANRPIAFIVPSPQEVVTATRWFQLARAGSPIQPRSAAHCTISYDAAQQVFAISGIFAPMIPLSAWIASRYDNAISGGTRNRQRISPTSRGDRR
jgi:hypothetical protein